MSGDALRALLLAMPHQPGDLDASVARIEQLSMHGLPPLILSCNHQNVQVLSLSFQFSLSFISVS
jgi:hypothetical protein